MIDPIVVGKTRKDTESNDQTDPIADPLSVICSPSHMSMMVPAVIVNITSMIKKPRDSQIIWDRASSADNRFGVPAFS